MEALQEARIRGIVVVLVTGRILSDLKRGPAIWISSMQSWPRMEQCSRFHKGRMRALGRPPPPALLDELCRRKVEFSIW